MSKLNPSSLMDFLAENHKSSHENEASFATHKIGFGPFTRWLVFCWHEAIGAKYWTVETREDAIRLGEIHLEAGERVANQGRTSR